MHVYGEISGRLTPEARLSGRITPQERIRGNITIPASILPEEYHGSYDIIRDLKRRSWKQESTGCRRTSS